MPAKATLASHIINVTIVKQIPILRPHSSIFSHEQASELNRLIHLLRVRKTYNFVIDLSGCTNISSEGLGTIAACRQWCHDTGKGCMGVVLPRDRGNEVEKLFDITGLSRAIGSALQRNARDAISYLKAFSPAHQSAKPKRHT